MNWEKYVDADVELTVSEHDLEVIPGKIHVVRVFDATKHDKQGVRAGDYGNVNEDKLDSWWGDFWDDHCLAMDSDMGLADESATAVVTPAQLKWLQRKSTPEVITVYETEPDASFMALHGDVGESQRFVFIKVAGGWIRAEGDAAHLLQGDV